MYLAIALREDVVTADRRFMALADKHVELKGRIRGLA
jgi:hypothetical protein